MKITALFLPSLAISIFIFFFRKKKIQNWILDIFGQHQDIPDTQLLIATFFCSIVLGMLYLGPFVGLTVWSCMAFFNNIEEQTGHGMSGIAIIPAALLFALIATSVLAKLILYIITKVLTAIV